MKVYIFLVPKKLRYIHITCNNCGFPKRFLEFSPAACPQRIKLVWNATYTSLIIDHAMFDFHRCRQTPMPCKLDLHAAAFGSLPNWLHLIPIDVPGALWYFIRRQRRSRAGWCATKFDHSILRRKVSTGTNDGPATKNRAGRRHKRTLQ